MVLFKSSNDEIISESTLFSDYQTYCAALEGKSDQSKRVVTVLGPGMRKYIETGKQKHLKIPHT